MPRFEVYAETAQASWRSIEEWERFLEYISELDLAVEAGARVSEASTVRGPEGVVLSRFVVSAEDEAEGEAIARDAFTAALVRVGFPADWTTWGIDVGATRIDTDRSLGE